MLRIEHATKVYKTGTFGGQELRAVSDVSFDVHKGEIVSLIGESGSGKTTIGKMVLKLVSTSSGKISFRGRDISELQGSALKEYYRKVQGVFQDPFSSYNPIFKADRVFSMIRQEFYPQVGDTAWQAKVESTLRSVGLNPADVLGKFPHQLSGGQLQRFLVARALLLDIEFLVADEIISMLDASTRIDVLNMLADLKEHGLSVLFITHDLSLGYYVSERAVILYRGSISEMGATGKVYSNPLHPYTEMLMNSVSRLDSKWDDADVELRAKQEHSEQGCVYYGRCHRADKSLGCDRRTPTLVEVEPNHSVACFHYAAR